jgi:dTDP-4-dehydrorhamnose 3,5-epimerase-like enzyme
LVLLAGAADKPMIIENRRIETRSEVGPNGWLLELWHRDSNEQVDQVYMTVVSPGAVKGPHLHMKRRGMFTCVSGNVLIVSRLGAGHYLKEWMGQDHDYRTVKILPGIPAALINRGTVPALVLNMPSPPWRQNEPDDWPVEDWNPDIDAGAN